MYSSNGYGGHYVYFRLPAPSARSDSWRSLRIIASPFWNYITSKTDLEDQKKHTYLRTMFPSLLITGPFSIVFGFNGGLMALNDRLKLRSMVVGEEDIVYIASEESAIRAMEPDAENMTCRWRAGYCNSKGWCFRMSIAFIYPEFEVIRNENRCISCRICVQQCANGVHSYNSETKRMECDESKCVNCHRCVAFCPTRALKIIKSDCTFP